MKLKTITLSSVLLCIIGCKQSQYKKENITDSVIEINQSKKVSSNLVDWVNAFNTNTLENSYDGNAIKIISSDTIISSASEIANHYRTHKNKITSIESLFSIEANKERGITYELVKYKTDNLKEYTQIVIWKAQGEKTIREFEFTGENTIESAQVDTTKIAERRKLWIELCNAHNPENLVKELYSANTMYFNHKPIVKGTEDLIKEYDYMSNENYALNLNPIKLEVINANLAFEIGQCSGSYNGKYILVWRKQADGVWKVYIDSNI
ncbi:hypothetical protein GTQ40_07310 [Flavobacteriaceae bacterium R38]|nr:hypothetical protein [Flavobacteriaceae bacterium R38]